MSLRMEAHRSHSKQAAHRSEAPLATLSGHHHQKRQMQEKQQACWLAANPFASSNDRLPTQGMCIGKRSAQPRCSPNGAIFSKINSEPLFGEKAIEPHTSAQDAGCSNPRLMRESSHANSGLARSCSRTLLSASLSWARKTQTSFESSLSRDRISGWQNRSQRRSEEIAL